MKGLIILISVVLSLGTNSFSQKVSDYIKCSPELGSVEVNGNASLLEIKKIGDVKKRIVPKKYDNHYYKSRYFYFGDTIKIIQHKGSFWDLKFKTSAIKFKYPSRIITHKGIQIGTSTSEDVMNTYGEPVLKYPYHTAYEFPNDILLWFYFYDSEETDTDYNPELKNKVVSIILN